MKLLLLLLTLAACLPCDRAGQCASGWYCNAAAARCLPCDDAHISSDECAPP